MLILILNVVFSYKHLMYFYLRIFCLKVKYALLNNKTIHNQENTITLGHCFYIFSINYLSPLQFVKWSNDTSGYDNKYAQLLKKKNSSVFIKKYSNVLQALFFHINIYKIMRIAFIKEEIRLVACLDHKSVD